MAEGPIQYVPDLILSILSAEDTKIKVVTKVPYLKVL